MGKLNKETFVCIDCETTGLDLENDVIIEVAASIFDLEKVNHQYESLVNPARLIPRESTLIHNISDEMVENQPKIREILPDLLKFIGRHPIVGHAVNFDIQMIANAAKREGIACTIENNQVYDTLRMARIYGESPTNSLEQLRKHFGISEEGAHRAMSDVVVNIQVFRLLAKSYQTSEELIRVLSRPAKLKVMPLGKYKGRLIKEVPLEYLLWAANKDFDRDLLFTLRSEIKRRKRGNLFSQATNPFKDL